jgi:hypothetical protein
MTMKRIAAVVASVMTGLVLSGCATSPNELRSEGVKNSFTLRAPPMRAAACAARAIDEANAVWWGHVPVVREGITPGTAELSIPGLMIIDFTPGGSGSRATSAYASFVMDFHRARYLAAIEGC